jgi:hypothetical protein
MLAGDFTFRLITIQMCILIGLVLCRSQPFHPRALKYMLRKLNKTSKLGKTYLKFQNMRKLRPINIKMYLQPKNQPSVHSPVSNSTLWLLRIGSLQSQLKISKNSPKLYLMIAISLRSSQKSFVISLGMCLI